MTDAIDPVPPVIRFSFVMSDGGYYYALFVNIINDTVRKF